MKAFNDSESTLSMRTLMMCAAGCILFYAIVIEFCLHLFD